MTKIQIIDPTSYSAWDDLLLTNKKSSFFHTAGWCRVLAASYGYKPLYFTQIDNDKLTGLLAVMEVNSPITGKRGVSLPFTDHCPVIAEDGDQFDALLRKVLEQGQKSSWKTLEIRGGQRFLKDKSSSNTFLTHDLALNKKENDILISFRSSNRRNIKKAQKMGVTTTILESMDSIREFYRLNCLTRKDHGLPPQPFVFFKNFMEHIISAKKGMVILAGVNEGKNIAGAVLTSFGQKAIFKYGASNRNLQQLRANNLVMWEAIRTYAGNGMHNFNFGRTEVDNTGLLQFKRGWGTREKLIYYYKYDLKRNDFVANTSQIKSSYPIFTKMPIPMLNLIGRVLYRHMA